MKKEIVKYDNQFNLSDLNSLNKIEQNIFFSICSEFTKNKTDKIEISLRDLKRKTQMVDRGFTQKQFETFIESITEKILKVIFSIRESPDILIQMPLFKLFITDFKNEIVKVSLNDCFTNYLYDIPEKIAFTQFELTLFLKLNSKYAKTLMRYLLQNFSGIWKVDFEQFRKLLGFTKTYSNNKVITYVDRIIPELEDTGIFSRIEYEIEKGRTKGSPIKYIIFHYKLKNSVRKEIEEQQLTSEFTPIKTKKEEVTTEIIEGSKEENSIYDPPLKIIKKVKEVEVEERCPNCNGLVSIKISKSGKKYKYCENNKYWKIGSSDCEWQEFID